MTSEYPPPYIFFCSLLLARAILYVELGGTPDESNARSPYVGLFA
jgi:hypothetical protein